MQNLNCNLRLLEAKDEPFLWEMLYQALYIPKGEVPPPRSVLACPEIAKYVEDWGRCGDLGVVAVVEGEKIGAAWSRFLVGEQKGYGYVDDKTPEISMAVKEGYRGRGLGTRLLKRLLFLTKTRGIEQVSLSVDKRNRAVDFYMRLGFEIFEELETAYTMVRKLS